MAEENELKLTVAEARRQKDVGRSVARISKRKMNELGIKQGDIIEVEGSKKTGAIVRSSYREDEGLDIIRLDGLERRNAGASIGEKVTVREADVREAERVTIAPTDQNIRIRGGGQALKRSLLGRPATKGDLITPTGLQSDIFSQIFGGIFQEMGSSSSFGLGEMRFMVTSTNPGDMVLVTNRTEVRVSSKPAEIEEGRMPAVTYEDIGGLDREIQRVREMVELPLRHPELFDRLGIEPPKGVLLHGPPGTGKTLTAKAVANESDAYFQSIAGPEIMSKFYGESEKKLREIFDEAEENAPSIIFIDEIDAIASKREETTGDVEKRVVSQLLSLMDGLESRGKIIVIAATNRVDAVDPALRRPGRFDREIEVGVPDRDGRKEILQIHTRGMPLSDDVDIDELADNTHGYVGADLASLAREAAMDTLRKILPKIDLEEKRIPQEILDDLEVTKENFRNARQQVEPSAMREVLVQVPDTHWDDIGGLDEVKQKLKESVEWPLKNPEAFDRVGIEAPNGVLLYGPPGTGKTMLARAVATESDANFISIKGPELLCLSKDTPIISSLCGLRTVEEFHNQAQNEYGSRKIGKVEHVEIEDEIEVPSINDEGRIERTSVLGSNKLWVDEAYNIKLGDGTEMTVSANQPFYSYQKGRIEWTKSEKLKEGDWIGAPKHLVPLTQNPEIPFPNYRHLRLVDEDDNWYYAKIFSTSDSAITKLPKHFTKDLGAFLGWFVAEGNISDGAVTICNKSHKEEIIELMEQFVPRERIKEYEKRVIVYSTPLVKYLESIFDQELENKTHIIRTPSELHKAPTEVKRKFIKAAWKGDGTVSDTKIEYSSMSQELANGLSYLLTGFGIKHKHWQRKDQIYLLTISGKKEMDKFKKKILNKSPVGGVRREYNAQYRVPDVSKILKALKEEHGLRYGRELSEGVCEPVISGRRRVGLIRLRRIFEQMKENLPQEAKRDERYRTLEKIANGDIRWMQIEEKEPAEPQFMYDLETENNSFIGGPIPLLLHNSKWVGESEKAVRETFKKARQAAPAVIFFDEIDAMVPKRGRRASGSQVGERVISQLLTELDGLEELEDVVVIGATNRPDLVDPALLRPGRFDRVILAGGPDEEARREIFEIHTRRIPLSDDVDLDELARRTEGYSGADIAAVCKEAGMLALRSDLETDEVKKEHFESAMKSVGPSITSEISDTYREFEKKHGKEIGEEVKEEIGAYY